MTRVSLLFPELLLLLVPLLFVYAWRGRAPWFGGAARLAMLVLLVLIAAVPLAPLGGKGVDVVVIVDLSRSMPAESRARALEIIGLIEERRAAGDRVGIVTYGREARIERLLEEFGEADVLVQAIDPDGSDLGGAISLAASLIPRDRPGRLLLLSDGEANGAPVTAAAHEAAARGIPVDVRVFGRGEAADLAVEALDLPGVVDEREPFQFTAAVRADRSVDAEAVLLRDGEEIARTTRTFQPGATQLTFRDVIDRPGVARYRLELSATDDRVPENNRGESAVRVEAPATILLVNASGGADNLSRALAAGKLPVQTVTPESMPQDLAGLLAYRAVILENVPASRVGPSVLENLTKFTSELGGGLLLTGGGASFGVGGYFKSSLDPFLPVSMEIKNEHRKLSLAMAVALDRSGSMTAAAGDGRTKMDLANLGTCSAIETLGPFDEVAVIAVDSMAHVVSPLVSASDKDSVCDQVRRIQAGGGGIFTYTALVTAAKIVQESSKGTRHIVLFADAADAEEPGDYQRLLGKLGSIGITVSVIALGSDSDSDAEFLKDVAARGKGRIHFTASVDDLPRLFAQEAITVARSSFVADPTPARTLADMVLLGELPSSPFPTIGGYNLSYLRPGATMGAVTLDDHKAPVLAFWHQGLGRIAAFTAEVDGEYSRTLNAWRDFHGFTVGIGRWVLGGDPPADVRATIEREGAQGIVRVELDPSRNRGSAGDVRAATATIVPPSATTNVPPQRLTLAWADEHTLEARFPLQNAGLYLGAVRLGSGQVLSLAPLTLPYSPEFEPRLDPSSGPKALKEVARITGGVERMVWDDVFSAGQAWNRQVRDLVLPLTLLLLILHVMEIAGRRMLLFEAARRRVEALKFPRPRLDWSRKKRPLSDVIGAAPSARVEPNVTPPPVAPKPQGSPLSRAKAKARNRMRG